MASDAVVEAVAGAGGGIVALLATYPLMTINTLQQTRGRRKLEAGEAPPPALSVLAELKELVKTEGPGRLYSGVWAAILGTAISQGVYFYLYSLLRDAAVARKHVLAGTVAAAGQASRTEELPVSANLVVASLAGMGNVLATNPIWTVSTRMQAMKRAEPGANGGDGTGALDVAATILAEDGPKGFWRGCAPSLVMVANPAIQYMLFEWLMARVREQRLKRGDKGPPSGIQVFLQGALAKLGATLATYPLQLVKTRLMSASKDTEEHMRYNGPVDAVRRILKDEGPLGFFDGMRTKIVQTVLAAAIMFYIREKAYTATRAVIGQSSPLQKVLAAA